MFGQASLLGGGRAVLLGVALSLVEGLAACAPSPSDSGPSGGGSGLDVSIAFTYSQSFQQYIDALLLCGEPARSDWEEAKRQLTLLQPFFVFKEDPELIKAFVAGSEDARRELAHRGRVLQALTVFAQMDPATARPIYDKARWDEARRALMAEGEAGQHLLVKTLMSLLLNGQFRAVWVHVRYNLVEVGPMALETTAGVARELAKETPADTPIFRIDDLTQVFLVLIRFGNKSRPFVEEFSRHPKPNVRRALAGAIKESEEEAYAAVAVRLLAEDSEWTVRTGAAQALGKMAGAKAVGGKALVEHLKKERDRVVLLAVLEAIGELHYEEAVPNLMAVLEVPSYETATASMSALYHITGEKFTRKEQWLKWYVEAYPRWKLRQPR